MSTAAKRLQTELRNMTKKPLKDVYATPTKDDLCVWDATIEGPPDTPFENGKFNKNPLDDFEHTIPTQPQKR